MDSSRRPSGPVEIDVRVVEEHEAVAWHQAMRANFLNPPAPVEISADWVRRNFAPGRFLGAWRGDRCVGTLRSIPLQLTVPGGATLAASGVSAVSTATTHRGSGVLTWLMHEELEAARGRGEAVAMLVAVEHRIYGRFGFGQATRQGGLAIDVLRSGGLRPGVGELRPGARLAQLTMDQLAELGPELFDRFRRTRPGAVSRPAVQWDYLTGRALHAGRPFLEPFAVVHCDPAGRPTALLTFRTDRLFSKGDPDTTLTVVDHFAADPDSAAALWRYVFGISWIRHVQIPSIAPDDPLPLLLQNPRAAERTGDQSDDLWLRILDAPTAFAARSYDVPGETVLEVEDKQGYIAGRWLLATHPDRTGTLTPTTRSPDLSLDAAALAALYLGAVTVPHLTAAHLATELVPGAAARAGLQLRSAVEPWCPDEF